MRGRGSRSAPRASEGNESSVEEVKSSMPTPSKGVAANPADVDKDVSNFARKIAATYAPRSSTAKGKNPAVKGSLLYKIFEVQAVLSIFVGGLAAYNVIYPSEGPTIARMLGMWSVWALAVPSLRARDCDNDEKDALNLLFIAIPLLNVTLPLVWRSFAAVFSADVLMLAGVYFWKLGGLPAGGVFTDSDAE